MNWDHVVKAMRRIPKTDRPLTFAEQVKDAQRVLRSWTKDKRESVQLEGPTRSQP